jgi:hypothetical protein
MIVTLQRIYGGECLIDLRSDSVLFKVWVGNNRKVLEGEVIAIGENVSNCSVGDRIHVHYDWASFTNIQVDKHEYGFTDGYSYKDVLMCYAFNIISAEKVVWGDKYAD